MLLKKVKIVVSTNYKSPVSDYTLIPTLCVTKLNPRQANCFPVLKVPQSHTIEDLFTPWPVLHILIKL